MLFAIKDEGLTLIAHTSISMKSSTGLPALTSNITRRGFFNTLASSLMDHAPMTLVPVVV
jgi:hypothetical protein